MPIRKFHIESNGKVIDVGLRSALIPLGLEYNLKVFARNLYGEKKVEVILCGNDEDIKAYWQYVKKHDIRPVKNEKFYTVSKIQPYEGLEPDWVYHTTAFSAEQISKGVKGMEDVKGVLGNMNQKLGGIDQKMDNVAKRFGVFSRYAKGMDEKLKSMDEKLDKIATIPEKIDALPDGIVKALGLDKEKSKQ
jgi:acylphosphatase